MAGRSCPARRPPREFSYHRDRVAVLQGMRHVQCLLARCPSKPDTPMTAAAIPGTEVALSTVVQHIKDRFSDDVLDVIFIKR